MTKMCSPYGLELVENCEGCSIRSEGFFCSLSASVLQELNSIKYTIAYPENTVLFVEGESPRGVFMLCQGQVKLSMTSSDGKTIILRIAKPGDILGVDASVAGKPFQATAETLEPCQVNFVGRKDFVRFLHKNVEASLQAAAQLSRSYQIACDQIRLLGLSHSAPERLARFLLDWTKNGQQTKERTCARLPLNHEEIGQIIGVSRETTTRIFGNLRDRQLVALNGSSLLIENRSELERFTAS